MKKCILILFCIFCGALLNAKIVDTSNFRLLDTDKIDYNRISRNSGNTDEQGHSIVKVEHYIDLKTKHYWLVSYYDDNRILMRDLDRDFKNEK